MHNLLSYPPPGAPIRNGGPALPPSKGHNSVSYFLIDLIGSCHLRGRSKIQGGTGGTISPSSWPGAEGRTASHAS
jgi:hypothetical protein